MATKITTDMIKQINELYVKYKTYAAVAREMGIAASTVKKYVYQGYQTLSQAERKTFNPLTDLPEFSIDMFINCDNFGSLCVLSEEEAAEIIELQREIAV